MAANSSSDSSPWDFMSASFCSLAIVSSPDAAWAGTAACCCFSAFKQHFAIGQAFTYSLSDLARYYRDYVASMAHVDAVLPGRVHRVIYEDLVADTETAVNTLVSVRDKVIAAYQQIMQMPI